MSGGLRGTLFTGEFCPYCLLAKEGILMYELFHGDLMDHIKIVDTSFPHPERPLLDNLNRKIFGDSNARLPTMMVDDIGIITSINGQHHTDLLKTLKRGE